MNYLTLLPADLERALAPLQHHAYVVHRVCISMTAADDLTKAHDVPCPICMDSLARARPLMRKGEILCTFHPCDTCAQNHWITTKMPPGIKRLLQFLHLIETDIGFNPS